MILVTGGTGFVGGEVVRELVALGCRVRLLVRDSRKARRWANHPQVDLFEGDALCPETLPAAMNDVQAVIHLIGIIAETSKITFEQGHMEATRNVLVAAQQAGVTRWIQMSAIGTRSNASSRYHLTKWQAEELVRESGLDWTILRPSLIYGYDDRDRLLNMLRSVLSLPLPAFPLLDGGRTLVQPVSVREVAHCFAIAVSKEASIGRTYDLVGPVALSWRDMIRKIAATLGKKIVYEEVPLLLALRGLLGLTLVLVPVLIVVGLMAKWLSVAWAEVGVGLEVGLMVAASQWTQLIIMNLPSAPFLMLAEVLNAFAPRGLQMSEQLKMAVEDNVGDPGPAAETFQYVPETFEQGLARCYGLVKRVDNV